MVVLLIWVQIKDILPFCIICNARKFSWSFFFFFSFFLKFLLDTCPFVGPLIPLFWTSGDVSSGFQSQSGFCLIRTCRGVRNIRSLRFTSGATHLPVYNASIAASHLPHVHVSAVVGCQDLNRRPPAWQSDALPTRPRRHKFSWSFFFFFLFFLKFLLDTCPFVGPLIPLFWTSGDVSSGFQSRVGSALFELAEAYVIYVP